jgi:hypothetical protein
MIGTLLQNALTKFCSSRAALWVQALLSLQVVRVQELLTKDPPSIVFCTALLRLYSNVIQGSLSDL